MKNLVPQCLLALLILIVSVACQPAAKMEKQKPKPVDFRETVEQLIHNDSTLYEWVDPEALAASRRLGISYKKVAHKFLIQNGIDVKVQNGLKAGVLKYTLADSLLEDGFRRVTLEVASSDYEFSWIFRNGRLSSPIHYYSRNWQQRKSRFFRFLISDPADFNKAAIAQLDEFVDELAETLALTPGQIDTLGREKIDYVLCHSPEEIEVLTGFNTRGIYILAFDQVVSTFNTHFHEVAHLLLNFKQRESDLFVHPFLQEGFATAMGGRGGKSTRVINELGAFLQISEFMKVNEILDADAFRNNDASLTYPLSGVYHQFLLSEWSIDKYLDYYQKWGSASPTLRRKRLRANQLPPMKRFNDYVKAYQENVAVFFTDEPSGKLVLEADWGQVWDEGESFRFSLTQSLQLSEAERPSGFLSQEYGEIFSDRTYSGEKYLLEVGDDEIKLFNLYFGRLDAFYSNGLTLDRRQIKRDNGHYEFNIRKEAFENDLLKMVIEK